MKETETIYKAINNGNTVRFYITTPTIFNIQTGNIKIKNLESKEVLTLSRGLFFIKKNIFVEIIGLQNNSDLHFDLIEIPEITLTRFCRENSEINKNRREWIKKTKRIRHCNEIISEIKSSMKKQQKSKYSFLKKEHTKTMNSEEKSEYLIRYILSCFIEDRKVPYILFRSSEVTFSEMVFDIIYAAPHENWSLDDMAKNLHLSKSTLKRKLQAEGTSFSMISVLSRINKAAWMLRSNEKKVQSIAKACGFTNPSHFSTSFKKIFNAPPQQYRKMFKQHPPH
ncbi:helix-turn-helix domain-containing protein [Escherichia coli]|nr:helix-turn-helix domain-containing protein [Escherichia coli]EKD2461789.1 helix-turn-helix domain-containing protein [Escherichia coli]